MAGLDTSLLYLSSEEADDFGKAFEALCAQYIHRRIDPSGRPEDLTPVEITLLLVPLAPTASGS